jgi:hypothetical protein
LSSQFDGSNLGAYFGRGLHGRAFDGRRQVGRQSRERVERITVAASAENLDGIKLFQFGTPRPVGGGIPLRRGAEPAGIVGADFTLTGAEPGSNVEPVGLLPGPRPGYPQHDGGARLCERLPNGAVGFDAKRLVDDRQSRRAA